MNTPRDYVAFDQFCGPVVDAQPEQRGMQLTQGGDAEHDVIVEGHRQAGARGAHGLAVRDAQRRVQHARVSRTLQEQRDRRAKIDTNEVRLERGAGEQGVPGRDVEAPAGGDDDVVRQKSGAGGGPATARVKLREIHPLDVASRALPRRGSSVPAHDLHNAHTSRFAPFLSFGA